ncbi:MAG: hypothetical protein KKB50_11420 [Planctomycetes bacterium]|nr:hypothetical protein [Planctomycetota bacterium]
MALNPFRRGAAREWFVALCAYALLVAPFGCQLQDMLLDNGTQGSPVDLDTTSTGLFLNDDANSKLLMGGRGGPGHALFVYGTRDAAGNPREIESLQLDTAEGGSAFIIFEDGYPVHARGLDGSYVNITYNEVSTKRLAGVVELYDASTGTLTTYPVDIDLQQTAAQVSELIRTLTGEEFVTPDLSLAEAKLLGQSRLIGLRALLFAVPLVALVGVAVVVLGQVLAAVLEFVAETIKATIQVTLLAALSPLYILTDLLNDLLITIEFVPMTAVFEFIPSEPFSDAT